MITYEQVRSWLQLPAVPEGGQPDPHLTAAIAAAIAYVSGLPVVVNRAESSYVGDEPEPWPDDVQLGAIMLAARLFRRRNSPAGVEAISEAGATYVARYDSDISRLLQLDTLQRPAVG